NLPTKGNRTGINKPIHDTLKPQSKAYHRKGKTQRVKGHSIEHKTQVYLFTEEVGTRSTTTHSYPRRVQVPTTMRYHHRIITRTDPPPGHTTTDKTSTNESHTQATTSGKAQVGKNDATTWEQTTDS
ncbi:hypothetical protein Taro_042953, partial [Colocasia esculenta]|nr:hypothetical protein [Colocasia esculenta]